MKTIDKIEQEAAEIWLRMAFAANPGLEAEDDWGVELPTDATSEETPDVDALMLRTVSF